MSSPELNKETENVPNEGMNVEKKVENQTDAPVESVVDDQKTDEEEVTKVDFSDMSKSELVDALKDLLEKDIESIKDDVERIKQVFYKKVKQEVEDQKKVFLENGGEDIDFKPEKNELENTFKSLLNDYKSKKSDYTARLEKDKENNLLQKQHILEQMKSLVEVNDDVSSHINEFKALQQKWKSIGQVPAHSATELWKQYNINQEAFWDLIKINNELREYDFKKNLEAKTLLCEAAEKLADEEDIISAFQQLQKLHEEWHELGPVSRELREEIWMRFKEASSVINKKHQAHFEGIRKLEEENQTAKIALCEKLEGFDFSNLHTYKEWDEATQTILSWQDDWRTIGFAPRKVNQKLFERYRSACDAFFAAKAEFYKESKATLSENLEKKRELCELAESMKDSTEWKETTEKFVQIQKDWKTIGPVAKKYSDELWKRFITACDYFFEQKNKNVVSQKTVEIENLKLKKDLIEEISHVTDGDNATESLAKLRELMSKWNEIGHVPFKEKDKIYKEYRAAVDKQFDTLNIDASQRRLDTFKNNLKDMTTKGENKLYRERDKLYRAYEHLKSEILTYENNIGFFNTSTKKGGGLIKEMERKIDALKEESKLIEQKINLIEEQLTAEN